MQDTPAIAQQVAILSESAAELVRRGQRDEAAKVYERIFEIAPYNLDALDFLAVRAYERGDNDLSVQLLERASQVNPKHPMTYLNLAVVYKARGEPERALEMIERGLQLKPIFPNALLHKGELLEEMGREPEAMKAYFLAFKRSPRLRDPARVAAMLPRHRELTLRGDAFIKRTTLRMLDESLAPLRSAHEPKALERVEEFVDLYLGRRAPRYRHAAQRPTFLYFPELEPRPFFEREAFEWCAGLEAASADIRAELKAILETQDGLQPYVDIQGPDAGQWAELNKSLQWSSFHLYKAGSKIEANCRRCPATVAALEKLPLPRTPGHSPEAFFSILKPGTRIPPHFGLGNYKLAAHLPLMVPSDCGIRVGNETRSWQEGRCLIFDDSFRHEAWNESGEMRAVLIFDVWNPQLTPVEQSAVAAVLDVIGDLERTYGDPVATN